MAGKVETIEDLLANVDFLPMDTKVRSANGNPIWIGIKRRVVNGITITEVVIEGELKEIVKVKHKFIWNDK